MQKTLVTFSFMLLLKVRAGFPISIFVVVVVVVGGGGGAPPPPGVEGGGTVYIILCQHTRIYNGLAILCPYALPFLKRRGKSPVKPKYKHVLNGY